MARQKAWSADATARINAFQESIAPLFENADAPATDIHAALLRADIFVSEPNAFAQAAENVVILVTDGVETVDPQTPAHFSAPAELLLVNGTGSEATPSDAASSMREMRFFRSMHRAECKDSIPRVGVFKTARNDLFATQIRRAIRHLGRNTVFGGRRGSY